MSRTLRLSFVMAFNGGYVDTAGFITLRGLFVDHMTGNLVLAGAALFHNTAGVTAGLLALPVFCLTVMATHLVSARIGRGDRTDLRLLLGLQVARLAVGGLMAVALAPFADSNGPTALWTGMTLVVAMAVQNGAYRTHFPQAPPSTFVTGTITQLMLDLTELTLHRPVKPADPARIAGLATSVTAFALGCCAAALLCATIGPLSFAVPPLLALLGRRLVCAGAFSAVEAQSAVGPS